MGLDHVSELWCMESNLTEEHVGKDFKPSYSVEAGKAYISCRPVITFRPN